MPVFHHKVGFAGLSNLAYRGQATVRKDIFINPGINIQIGFFRTDSMEQEYTFRFQITIHHRKIGIVIFRSDVLEHPHRNNTIKLVVQVTIILQQNGDIQAFTAFLSHFLLFGRNGDADHAYVIVRCHVVRQSAPAAANIQYAHPWF